MTTTESLNNLAGITDTSNIRVGGPISTPITEQPSVDVLLSRKATNPTALSVTVDEVDSDKQHATRLINELVDEFNRHKTDAQNNHARHAAIERELRAQVNAAQARQEAAITEQRERTDRVQVQLNDFKHEVEVVASRYGKEHEMCHVLNEALEELGLERISTEYSADLVIRVRFDAELRETPRSLDNSWVRSSLDTSALEEAIRDAFEMDEDHDSSSVGDVEFEVENIRETD